MSRFFRRGPVEVLRKQLDIKDQLATDVESMIMPTMEARAARPWEDFDEGLIRWVILITQPAVPAAFGVILINELSSVLLPPDTVFTIDEVKNLSTIAVTLRVEDTGVPGTTAQQATFSDDRWGPAAAGPDLSISRGSLAAQNPTEIVDRFPVGVQPYRDVWIGQVQTVSLGGNHSLAFWGDVVNTAVTLVIRGKLIPRV